MNYYIARGAEQLGEFDEMQVRAGLQNRTYQSTDLGWAEGMADWRPLGEIFGGAPAVVAAPPPHSYVPHVTATAPPNGHAKSAGSAIAALILGLISPFLCILSGIPAVVFGHIGLSKIKRSAGTLKGKGMAVTGLVLGYLSIASLPVVIMASLALPVYSTVQQKGITIKSINDVRQLITACKVYASDNNGKMPDSLDDLAKGGTLDPATLAKLRKDIVAGKNSQVEYIYAGKGHNDSDPHPDTIAIIYSSQVTNGKRVIGYLDNSVKLTKDVP